MGTKIFKSSFGLAMISLLAVLSLSGCMTANPYTGQREVNKTTIGTGLGALVGAGVGALATRSGEGAAIGAAIGGAAGAAGGYYMDRQADQLRQELAGSGVQVMRQGKDIRLIMPGNITFATNQASLRPEFYRTLNSVAIVLKKFDKTVVRVIGYTDNTGTPMYNQELSERRARSVADYLISQGVNANRFAILGYGERQPIASNDTAEGRQANRRVEITIREI